METGKQEPAIYVEPAVPIPGIESEPAPEEPEREIEVETPDEELVPA